MKKALAALLAVSMIAFAGYGCDGGGTVTDEDAGYISGTSEARLYYPSSISSPTGATSMSSGYTGTLDNIEWLSEMVAESGYVVLAFTPTNTLGMVSGWRDAHKNCIDELKDINSSHSTLRGLIDTSKLNCSGHSKGGGGSLWAASQLGSQLRTVVAFAPYQEGFSDSTLRSVTAAAFIQAGSGDTLATNSMTRGEYSGLTNISRKYVEYTGWNHMAWSDATGSTANRVHTDLIAWFKYYMDGDDSQASSIRNESGTSRFEWVDLGNGGGSSSSSSSGGCN